MKRAFKLLFMALFFPPAPSHSGQAVAVLPFENRSGDPSLDWLGQGLAQGLADKLHRVPALRTVDPSLRFKSGMGVDAGDVNGDGAPDLIVTNFSYETNSLYRNLGSGLFVDATEDAGLSGPSYMPLGFGIHLFDFDNDGDLDLFVDNGHIFPNVTRFSAAESYAQHNQLFRNDNGVFTDVSEEAGFAVPAVSRGSAVGDLDGDGDLDLVVSISGGRPRIYRNDRGNRNHWLTVKLVGGMGKEREKGSEKTPSLSHSPTLPLCSFQPRWHRGAGVRHRRRMHPDP